MIPRVLKWIIPCQHFQALMLFNFSFHFVQIWISKRNILTQFPIPHCLINWISFRETYRELAISWRTDWQIFGPKCPLIALCCWGLRRDNALGRYWFSSNRKLINQIEFHKNGCHESIHHLWRRWRLWSFFHSKIIPHFCC